ncbi:MAG: FtsB family cell division protein [Nocardioides sp.]
MASATAVAARKRPRFTSRATVLLLVLAVLVVSYASSARAYLQQRGELDALRAEIAEREESIAVLEREMRRWDDPAFVQQEARALGYVMPGETSYVVLDENGEPLEQSSTLADPDEVGSDEDPAFWEDAWDSVVLAGRPPVDDGTVPVTEIDGSDE